jgi:pyridoxal phosphate enzyme (YggS family)
LSEVAENLAEVQAKIAAACRSAGRSPADVTLVAVSKKQPVERVRAVYDAGQRAFGENYVQELLRRIEELPADVVWHMIGHVQTNKAKGAAQAAVVHTVDSEKLARALAKSVAPGRITGVLIEVNTGGEETKSGIAEASVAALARAVSTVEGLSLRGLMCIPPAGEGRRFFAHLRELRDRVAGELGVALPDLSMGMSDDYEDAVREGSTIVRVGTAIFGARTAL